MNASRYPTPVPDEYGLSEDSLRGSTQHIAIHLIGGTQADPNNTNNILTRDPLSTAELEALRQRGTFVDNNGNGIDDREEIERLAPPGFFASGGNVGAAPMPSIQPNGYWAQREGQWVFYGERPPGFAPTPSSGTGGGAQPNQDPSRAFSEYQMSPTSDPQRETLIDRVRSQTSPLLAEDSPPVFGAPNTGETEDSTNVVG